MVICNANHVTTKNGILYHCVLRNQWFLWLKEMLALKKT